MRVAAVGVFVLALAGCGGVTKHTSTAAVPPKPTAHAVKTPIDALEAGAEGRALPKHFKAVVHFKVRLK
jgi:hypothetical protein